MVPPLGVRKRNFSPGSPLASPLLGAADSVFLHVCSSWLHMRSQAGKGSNLRGKRPHKGNCDPIIQVPPEARCFYWCFGPTATEYSQGLALFQVLCTYQLTAHHRCPVRKAPLFYLLVGEGSKEQEATKLPRTTLLPW